MRQLIILLLCAFPALAQPLATTTVANNGLAGVYTSTPINTTGATLLTATSQGISGLDPAPTPANDSKGNAWTCLTNYSTATPRSEKTCYVCINSGDTTHVGPGHTIDLPNVGELEARIVFAAWSGVGGGPNCLVAGTDHGGTTGVSVSGQPGSVTPSKVGDLVLTAFTEDHANTTVTAPFSQFGGTNGKIIGYYTAADLTPRNPTWTGYLVYHSAMNIAVFTSVSAPASSPRKRRVLGE